MTDQSSRNIVQTLSVYEARIAQDNGAHFTLELMACSYGQALRNIHYYGIKQHEIVDVFLAPFETNPAHPVEVLQ